MAGGEAHRRHRGRRGREEEGMGEVQVEAGAEEAGGSCARGLAVGGGGDAGGTAGGDGAQRKG